MWDQHRVVSKLLCNFCWKQALWKICSCRDTAELCVSQLVYYVSMRIIDREGVRNKIVEKSYQAFFPYWNSGCHWRCTQWPVADSSGRIWSALAESLYCLQEALLVLFGFWLLVFYSHLICLCGDYFWNIQNSVTWASCGRGCRNILPGKTGDSNGERQMSDE